MEVETDIKEMFMKSIELVVEECNWSKNNNKITKMIEVLNSIIEEDKIN